MAQFSPFTRRLVALGLLFLLVLGVVNLIILPIASQLEAHLSTLADARFRLAKLKAIEARPLPADVAPVPQNQYLAAADAAQANDQFRALVAGHAARLQLQLERADVQQPTTRIRQQVELALTVSGQQEQLLNFINQLEQGAPLMRFKLWRLTRELASADAQPVGSFPLLPANGSAPTTLPDGSEQSQSPPINQTGRSAPEIVRLTAVIVAIWQRPL
jgi:Type II secretion system (T2SS), protein M subtype b